MSTCLDRPVALKVLPATAGAEGGPGARRRWLREARAVASLRHQNVVTLYDHGEADDGLYLVLEHVPGGTLKKRLTGPLPPRVAANLVELIARAVGCFHDRGLLHLDLKPSNILLDGAEDAPWDRVIPKVSDFGLALSDGDAGPSETSLAGIRGTPAYMAPEQANASRGRIGAAADIYALGAILYELLTGRPPFQGASTLETLDQVRGQEPVPPRRLNPKIHRDLETIALKCLEKDPSRRYAPAGALADDLRSWLDGRPIHARPVSAVEKTWRWCRRRPMTAALAATLMLTVSVSFIAVVALWRQAEANVRMTMEVVGDLFEMVAGGENGFPKAMTLDRLIPARDHLRQRLLALASRRPDDLLIARQLARVESGLSFNLMGAGRHEEARILLVQGLERAEGLVRRHPSETMLGGDLRGYLEGLADVSERLGRAEDAIAYRRRIIRSCEEEMRHTPTAAGYLDLMISRRGLAWFLYGRGDREQAASLLAANRHALEDPPAGCEGRRLAVERLLCRTDPSRDAAEPAPAWAAMAARALRSVDPDPAAAARREAEDAFLMAGQLASLAAALRRSGDVEGVGAVAQKMLAMARHVAQAHPDQPTSHLALSLAYAQFYKNASRIGDRAAVKQYLSLSLDAALQAKVLDPDSELVRHTVDGLQRRLKDLPHPR